MDNIRELKKITEQIDLGGSEKIKNKKINVSKFIKQAKQFIDTFTDEDIRQLSGHCPV
jgi:hypothetical protein